MGASFQYISGNKPLTLPCPFPALFFQSLQAQIPHGGVAGTNQERTFIAIKPDGVERSLVGEIISRFEKKGFQLVGLKMIWPTKEKAAGHYSDLSSKPFFNGLVEYFSSGPIVAMAWQGKQVISTGRKILGATNPLESEPGTIRGDFAIDIGRNVCHGSDLPESAEKELGFWFAPEELNSSVPTINKWIYE